MDRRTKFRQNLSVIYLPSYDALCENLGTHWQPYQGFRTFAEQDKLYAQGRTSPGKIVTQAKGGQSAHCYGCASDWTVWDVNGHPIWLEANDPIWGEYIIAIEKCGLRSGASFGDIDHNEVAIKCSWSKILDVFQKGSIEAVQNAIKIMIDDRRGPNDQSYIGSSS